MNMYSIISFYLSSSLTNIEGMGKYNVLSLAKSPLLFHFLKLVRSQAKPPPLSHYLKYMSSQAKLHPRRIGPLQLSSRAAVSLNTWNSI